MARGTAASGSTGNGTVHALVPELEPDQDFRLTSNKPFDEFREALLLAHQTLAEAAPDLSLMVCSYFGPYAANLPLLPALGGPGRKSRAYIDTFRAKEALSPLLAFPDRFGSIEDARAFCREFFTWYNTCHYHSGLAHFTPEDVHYGQVERKREARQETLRKAFEAHPERFVKGVCRSL